jgi:hypothetical protein
MAQALALMQPWAGSGNEVGCMREKEIEVEKEKRLR